MGVWKPEWVLGENVLSACGRQVNVFGIAVCVSPKAWRMCQRDQVGQSKCDYVANVLAQFLDNDMDGFPDDSAVAARLHGYGSVMLVSLTEAFHDEFDIDFRKLVRFVQIISLRETIIGSCQVPSNRGATAGNRWDWSKYTSVPDSCNPRRDAAVEEIFHLITEAASDEFPHLWGRTFASRAGAAVRAANGNCGWGFSKNWSNPGLSQPACRGYFAYKDASCGIDCLVIEGIYWASLSYVGGFYTMELADFAADEWLMTAPDGNMTVLPPDSPNARTLQAGSPGLYELVKETTAHGHAWLPAVMPNGQYTVQPFKKPYIFRPASRDVQRTAPGFNSCPR